MPVSQDAERSILGALLLNNNHFYDDLADLAEEDFSLDSNRKIFSVMYSILSGLEGEITHVDYVTVTEVLARRKQLGIVGGHAYVASLTENLPRRVSIAEYVSLVREKARLRRLIHICNGVMARAVDQVESAQKIAADLQDDLVEEAAEGAEDAVRISEVIPEVRRQIEAGRKIVEGKTAGLTWGLSGLDAITHGAQIGEMTVIAASAGGFKTAYAVQMVLANGREGVPCCMHSIEMRKDRMTRRFYPAMSDFLKTSHMREPRLMSKEHMMEMDKLSEEMAKLPIWIDDKAQDIRKLIARMRMMRRKHGIKLFAIDYFQLIHNDQTKTDIERYQKNAHLLRDAMKGDDMSDCHLVVLSQFAKNKGRGGKGRSGDDLYGGTALNHAAQNVIIITVESGKDKEPGQFLDAQLDIDKMRDGARAKHECMVDPDFLRFQYPIAQQSAF